MEFKIENRPVFTTLTVNLQEGETVRAESGAMVSMSPTIELKSKKQGKGLGGMLKAAIGGEGLFASEFTATGGTGELVLAPPTPGDVISFELQGKTILAQSGAYLAGALDLELSTQGSFKAMLSALTVSPSCRLTVRVVNTGLFSILNSISLPPNKK
ncbi:MAG TPA: AIM24 family protein, partial [bacterium]|nr:AIM24 family protein [bacterium]